MFMYDLICAFLVSETAWQDYLARSNVPQKLEADLMDPYCRCLNSSWVNSKQTSNKQQTSQTSTILGLSELVNLNIQPVMWIFMDFYIANAKRILQGYPWWIWFSSVQGVFSLSFIDLYVDLDLCVFAAVVTCCHIRWWFGAALCNTPSRLHCRRLGPTVAWLKHDETYELITRENAVSNEDIIQGFLCIRYPRCLGEVCPKCSIEFL